MHKKGVQTIFRVICALGFMLMLGTAGASDCNTIGLTQIIIQGFIGLAMFGGGAYFGGLMR